MAPLFPLLFSPAMAGSLQDAWTCLHDYDFSCALEHQKKLVKPNTSDPDVLEFQARTLFHQGRFDEALEIAEGLEAQGHSFEKHPPPYKDAAQAAKGFSMSDRGDTVVRTAPGVDIILVDEAHQVLEACRQVYSEILGPGPDYPTHMDIFPDGTRFIAASGLPPQAVHNTGVIALSKWNRLLLTSPRAMGRGYGWKDTVAHEYIHLHVAYQSRDETPVWLQEGLAKYLEGKWRGEHDRYLTVHQQSLLAEAVHTDSFVPFEKFKHSMAYLDSGEEAALAFAQVSTMVGFIVELEGYEGLRKVLGKVRRDNAMETFAEVAGYPSFEAFTEGWKDHVRTLPLVQQRIATLPINLDEAADEFGGDPLLSERRDLARFARIGDLLRERGAFQAALVEYNKATDPEGPPSPLLFARRARCHIGLQDQSEAIRVVEEGVRLYPEFTLLQVTRAQVLDALGRAGDALLSWKAAHDLNPYDPSVQQALIDGYTAAGNDGLAQHHTTILKQIQTGGVIDVQESHDPTQ